MVGKQLAYFNDFNIKIKGLQNCKPFYGRGDETRTHDLLVPNQARYHLRYTPTTLKLYSNGLEKSITINILKTFIPFN